MSTSTSAAAHGSSTYLTLPSGSKMPYIGLGLWKAEKGSLADVVETAVRLGYRHFDSAADYGNEQQTGEGLQRAISKGLVKREELFVTTKLWSTYHAREHVRPALERCLADLKLDYVDLFLVHFPISCEYVDFKDKYPPGWCMSGKADEMKLSNASHQETWEAMVHTTYTDTLSHTAPTIPLHCPTRLIPRSTSAPSLRVGGAPVDRTREEHRVSARLTLSLPLPPSTPHPPAHMLLLPPPAAACPTSTLRCCRTCCATPR